MEKSHRQNAHPSAQPGKEPQEPDFGAETCQGYSESHLAESHSAQRIDLRGKSETFTEEIEEDAPDEPSSRIEDRDAEDSILNEEDLPFSYDEVMTLPSDEDEFHLIDYLMGHSPEDR